MRWCASLSPTTLSNLRCSNANKGLLSKRQISRSLRVRSGQAALRISFWVVPDVLDS